MRNALPRKRNSIGHIFRLALSFIVIAAFSHSLAADQRPNVILIITDDQSFDSLGFAGGNVHTPRIDQMAEEGMYFTDFNVTSTVCSPSRYSFMTGRFAGNGTGAAFMEEHPLGDQTQVENIGELEPDRWSLPRVLQKNGYITGFVGKSHLINHHWFKPENWEAHGLKTFPIDADPKDPEVSAKLKFNHDKWCDAMKEYGFNFVDGFYAANTKEIYNTPNNIHNLEWTVSKAFEFLDGARDKPFFLYFSTTLHHGPAPWVNKFSLDADPRMTPEGYLSEAPNVMPPRKDVLRRVREAGLKPRDAYATWLDDGVGAILDKVESLGLSEETLIIFVPDHGSYRTTKATLHDYGMRVPMLMKWEGKIQPGSRYNEIVANIDFAPTVMDILRIKPPANYAYDGLSFKSALAGNKEPIREVLFAELGHSRGVKTKDWKYIAVRYPEDIQKRIDEGKTFRGFRGEVLDRPYLTRNGHLGHHAVKDNPNYWDVDQLYNLNDDPEELENVYSQNPEIAERMKRYLSEELSRFENRPFGEFTD